MNNTESSLHDVTQTGVQLAKDAKKTLTDQIEPIQEEVSEYYKKGKSELKKAGRKLSERIQESPAKSVLIAGGIGFLLAMLCKK